MSNFRSWILGWVLILNGMTSVAQSEEKIYYHATNFQNFQSILQNGLLPNQGGLNPYGSSYGIEDLEIACLGKVHVTPEHSVAKEYSRFIIKSESAPPADPSTGQIALLLEVVLDSNDLTRDPDDSEAFYTTKKVEPHKIRPIGLVFRVGGKYVFLK